VAASTPEGLKATAKANRGVRGANWEKNFMIDRSVNDGLQIRIGYNLTKLDFS
jgi:hypothetical protein